MRIVSLFLALFILWLSSYPCSDTTDAVDNSIVEYSVVDASIQPLASVEGDFCSLLCSCHCCHVHVTLNVAMQFKTTDNTSVKYSGFVQDFESVEIFELLLPPIA